MSPPTFLFPSLSMCPQCEKCTTWTLHNICAYTRISYLFDNPGTVFYAVFMSFWGKYTLSGLTVVTSPT